jgi:hypothetical protein
MLFLKLHGKQANIFMFVIDEISYSSSCTVACGRWFSLDLQNCVSYVCIYLAPILITYLKSNYDFYTI